ncbi:MAG: glutamate racemase [Nitrospirota bacterium]
MNRSAPIGVFDSGIGGLTVVRELIELMPRESIIYLGDTARVPYGIRSPETVRRYALEGVRFLLSRGIKFLVVACNTVSAVGLEELSLGIPVPVVGVLKPGATASARSTASKKVGVIGTLATIRSSSYVKAIGDIAPAIEVIGRACPLFVPLVEEGWLEGPVPELAAGRYLAELKASGIDTLVLGCTHYPLLKPVISDFMGEGVRLVDSASETAREVKARLAEAGLENTGPGEAAREYCVTDSPEGFRDVGGRFLGRSIGEIKKVQLEVIRDEG